MNNHKDLKCFKIGKIRISDGIRQIIKNNSKFEHDVLSCLIRHKFSDWGELSDYDKSKNDLSVQYELSGLQTTRILSEYHLTDEIIWVITEADRSFTTVLLPEEY